MLQPVQTPETTPAPTPALSPRHAALLSSLLLLDHDLPRFAAENKLSATDLLAFLRDPAVQSALADLRAAAIDLDVQHSLRLRRKALERLERLLDSTQDPDQHLRIATILARTTRPFSSGPRRAAAADSPSASPGTGRLQSAGRETPASPSAREPERRSPFQTPRSLPQSPAQFSSARSLFSFLCDLLPNATSAQALALIAPHLAPQATINARPLSENRAQDLAPLAHSRKIVQVFLRDPKVTDSSAAAGVFCVAFLNRGSIHYHLTAAPDPASSPPVWRLTSIRREDDKPNTS